MSNEYRILGPKEGIEQGDEWSFSDRKIWSGVPRQCFGSVQCAWPGMKFRRRVQSEPPKPSVEELINIEIDGRKQILKERMGNTSAQIESNGIIKGLQIALAIVREEKL